MMEIGGDFINLSCSVDILVLLFFILYDYGAFVRNPDVVRVFFNSFLRLVAEFRIKRCQGSILFLKTA